MRELEQLTDGPSSVGRRKRFKRTIANGKGPAKVTFGNDWPRGWGGEAEKIEDLLNGLGMLTVCLVIRSVIGNFPARGVLAVDAVSVGLIGLHECWHLRMPSQAGVFKPTFFNQS